jgi:hypothetical protein
LTIFRYLDPDCAVDQFAPRPLFPSVIRVVFDPHQSPIWFKAAMFVELRAAPGPCGPQKTVGTMPIPFVFLQIIWF